MKIIWSEDSICEGPVDMCGKYGKRWVDISWCVDGTWSIYYNYNITIERSVNSKEEAVKILEDWIKENIEV